MKTFDDNWQALKTEDRSLVEPQPFSMQEAQDLKLVSWYNRPDQFKLQWTSNFSRHTAWFDRSQTWGLWRSLENLLEDYIRTDLVLRPDSHGYRVIKMTARSEQSTPMINVKLIEILRYNQTQDVFLVLDGTRVSAGIPRQIKQGQQWRFNYSHAIQDLLP